MLTACAQMCLCLSLGASVQVFHLLTKFWAHYFIPTPPEASTLRHKYSMNQASWTLLLTKYWFLFGLGGIVDRILFYLYYFHWPCHTHQEFLPPFLRAAGEREQKLSALHFIESSDAAKIPTRTQIYIHLESGMTNLSHVFRLCCQICIHFTNPLKMHSSPSRF